MDFCLFISETFSEAIEFDGFLLLNCNLLFPEETYEEEELDSTMVWYIVLASQLFRVSGMHIVSHKKKMLRLLRMIVPLTCRTACEVISFFLSYFNSKKNDYEKKK